VTAWRLEPLDGGAAIVLPADRAAVAGRGAACDIRISDDTVSRRHAELRADPAGLAVRDLGSINGTSLNGTRITQTVATSNDVVTFGSVAFRVAAGADATPRVREEVPPGTQIRSVDVRSGGGALARLAAERLARLVDLARQLSGEIEIARVLATVVDLAAELLPADRVALLLADSPGGELRLELWRNRLGQAPVEVPRSIARRAVDERVPVVTENAVEDTRFQSGSVVSSQVRAALCVPLLADQERVLGVLYLDSLTASKPFSESDAALFFAFAGLAAVSIAKAHYADAVRRDAVIRANFERFFTPGVAARIAGQESGAHPGGERRAVTVLFSDVRGFTGLAESMSPEALAHQLSEYFAAMVDLIFEHGGTLDKFIGDALLAAWGAPLAGPDDADRAVAAARGMQDEIAALNARWEAEGRPTLGIGVGLHYGDAFAGTIGSRRRLEYTVIGDVVNVAARLCTAAGAGEIVMSAAVRDRLREPPPDLGAGEPLALRGREAPVVVFRLADGN
jgi:adenylate cyclase